MVKPVSHERAWVLAMLAVGLLASSSTTWAGSPRRCKGTKVWYAGDCRYPDEVERLKAQQAQQQQAEQQQREADVNACRQARGADTAEAWRNYLDAYPAGSCREEALQRVETLESRPPPEPEPKPRPPEPARAAPAPAQPPPPPPPDGADQAGISPWVWVGFGVGAAGWLTWGITGAVSLSMSSDIKDDCSNDVCPPDREEDIDTAKVLAHVATAGFVVGAVGTTVGVIALVATMGSKDDARAHDRTAGRSRTHRLRITPQLGPGYVGVSGSF